MLDKYVYKNIIQWKVKGRVECVFCREFSAVLYIFGLPGNYSQHKMHTTKTKDWVMGICINLAHMCHICRDTDMERKRIYYRGQT